MEFSGRQTCLSGVEEPCPRQRVHRARPLTAHVRDKLRVLIFNWRDIRHRRAGGAEVMTHGYARNLVRRGHAVTLFTGGITGAPVEETIDGVTVVRRGGPVTTRIHAPRWYREQRRKGRDF